MGKMGREEVFRGGDKGEIDGEAGGTMGLC